MVCVKVVNVIAWAGGDRQSVLSGGAKTAGGGNEVVLHIQTGYSRGLRCAYLRPSTGFQCKLVVLCSDPYMGFPGRYFEILDLLEFVRKWRRSHCGPGLGLGIKECGRESQTLQLEGRKDRMD